MTRRTMLFFVLVVGCAGSEHGDGDGGAGVDAAAGTSPDGAPSCLAAEQACADEAECCGDLYCADNSLGRVCCGGIGEGCATAGGTDCCAQLACDEGVCGAAFHADQPDIVVYPVRGPHNNGYEAPDTGDPGQWSCDGGRSNSDFVGGDHLGNDIWAARGTPVVATVPGTLVYTGWSDYSGNKVTVMTDGGWYHFNCHLDSIAAGMVNGVHVEPGDVIGTVGNTGTASNGVVHLHYSIYPGDYNAGIDPWPYLYAVEYDVCD